MKILLVGFKLSIGNELYMNMLYKHLKENNIDVDICGDANYVNKYNLGNAVAKGGNSKQMVIDTLNPINWIKFYNILKSNKYDKIFFISSHTLNNIAIIISKLFKIEVISHIHDPIPHSGTKYGWIILFSQKLQAKLSDKIVVYGQRLKETVKDIYNINYSKIYKIKHGVYRDNIFENIIENNKDRNYISLLGRIDKYKGIDIFLKSIIELDNKINKDIKFVIGGEGDLTPYKDLIKKIKHRLIIKNYLLTNNEFDSILQRSVCLVLPYRDGTQTGNVQIAYYNSCPVIVTNVGSIPELVEDGETGFIINPNNIKELTDKILLILNNNNYEKMGKYSFVYCKHNLNWSFIIKDMINIFNALPLSRVSNFKEKDNIDLVPF